MMLCPPENDLFERRQSEGKGGRCTLAVARIRSHLLRGVQSHDSIHCTDKQ